MTAPTLWTPEQDATLTQLWGEGHATAEIGRRMGVSKNSVIGRVGRLGLPRRDNPSSPRALTVRKSRAGKSKTPREIAHRPRAVIEMPAPKPVVQKPQAGVLPALSPRVAPSAPPAVSGHPIAPSLWKTCQWPTGHKRTGHIEFLCTSAPQPGRPYCPACCAKAYAPRERKAA